MEQAAVLHEQDLVCDILHIRDDMGGEQNQSVFAQRADDVAEADALAGVEAGGGFIQYEDLRVVQERLGDADPADHTAGKGLESVLPLGG